MSLFRRLFQRSSGISKHDNVNLFPKDVWPIAAIMSGAVTFATGTALYIGSKPAAKWSKANQVGHQTPFEDNYMRENPLKDVKKNVVDIVVTTSNIVDDLYDRFKNGFYR
jgi:hypothetical protein